MAFDSSTKALLVKASDLSRQALFLTAGTAPRRSEHFRGEPMEIVVATNALRAMGDGKTFIPNLQGTAPNHADEACAATT
jgi:hypothetical protein